MYVCLCVHDTRTLAPLVHEEWRGFCIGRLDPRRKQSPLVRLVPEVLVEIGVRDLLKRFHIMHRDEVTVEIHELDPDLLEGSLGQKVPLDTRESLVGVVVSLFDQSQFLSLALIQTTLHTKCGKGNKYSESRDRQHFVIFICIITNLRLSVSPVCLL